MLPRLLTLLQFTRIALVFTAVGDGWAAMLLTRGAGGERITPAYAAAVTVASAALYTFGMALNDLIDRRRDGQLAPGRPLPSGRMSVRTARVVCGVLAALAVGAGVAITLLRPGQRDSLPLLGVTLALITFYDVAGKYLVAPGLLTLGLVRFFQATIAGPELAVPWQPLTLLVHVTLLSAACYQLEGKRPRLTAWHWLGVLGGLTTAVGGVLWAVVQRRGPVPLMPGLACLGGSALGFLIVASVLRRLHRDPRAAGRQIMLYGLLWLIVYDAAFVFAYDGPQWSLVILALLPLAWLSVQAMRAWSRIVELSHRPQYQRAR